MAFFKCSKGRGGRREGSRVVEWSSRGSRRRVCSGRGRRRSRGSCCRGNREGIRFGGNKGGAEVVEDEGVGNELTENKLAEAQR